MKSKTVSGKRKTSVAKVKVNAGSGKIIVNGIPYNQLNQIHRLMLEEPLRIAKKIIGDVKFDFEVKVIGGGRESQMDSVRLGLAKALVEETKSKKLKDAFMEYDKHLLVADTRRKESYKPGDSKARSKRQSSKR